MPTKDKKHFQTNNAHVHDDSSMATLIEQLAESSVLPADSNRRTLSGDITLDSGDDGDKMFQNIDPDGAARTVTLSDPTDAGFFVISNRAGAANALTVENSSQTTIATVSQDGTGVFWYDGTGWSGFSVSGTAL